MVVELLTSISEETLLTLSLISVLLIFLGGMAINELVKNVLPRITRQFSVMIQEREKQKTIRKAMQIHRDSEALSIAEDEFYSKTKELVDTDTDNDLTEEDIQEKLTALSEDIDTTETEKSEKNMET